MPSPKHRTIIVGLGNPLRSDDAVGLVTVRRVRSRLDRISNLAVREVHTGGLRLMEAMVGFERAAIVDALTSSEKPPGSVLRLGLDDLVGTQNLTCSHDTSLPAALTLGAAAGLQLPKEISIWGVQAADVFTMQERLTPAVHAVVPWLVDVLVTFALGGDKPLP